jgi:hypothetical protein
MGAAGGILAVAFADDVFPPKQIKSDNARHTRYIPSDLKSVLPMTGSEIA